jgi:hypothetical protein
MRPRLTYANVMATIAVFIALGGASYAAMKLPKNTVGSKQLKKEAVTANKVKKETLTGKQINLAKLGTVPSAANAQTLGGLSADQIAQSKLRCPAGTTLASGVCFESATRPEASFIEALETCASIDRSLPSPGPLASYLFAHPPQKTEANWAGSFFITGEFRGLRVGAQPNGELDIGDGPISGKSSYRCATSPTN